MAGSSYVMSAKIAIIGTGYVGSALDRYFQSRGIQAKLFDPPKGHHDAAVLEDAEVVFVAVPTPFYIEGDGFDDTYVRAALNTIPGENKVVVLKSTLQPGSTERLQAAFPQFRVLCNPEFLTQDRAERDMQFPNRQLVGYTAQSKNDADYIMALLPRAPFERIMPATAAETVKCATNSFYATKVAFANQLYDVCQKSGVDYEDIKQCIQAEPWMGGDMHWEVVHRGYRGYGGKCLPKDARMFLQHAEKLGGGLEILKQVEEYNNNLLKGQGVDIRWEEGSPKKSS
jgi:UDPglucose 6-dehydrogenase